MLVVEPLRSSDLQPVSRLAFDSLKEKYSPQWLETHSQGENTFLVARDVAHNEIVGFALAEQQEAEGHVLAIAVQARRRGEGIGRALLGQVRQEMACRGAMRLRLEVRADDPGTLVFYQRQGFAPEGLEEHVYADGGDAVVMTRPL